MLAPEKNIHPKTKATQDSLISVAYQLFSEQGYYQTTTKEIAERAGVCELTLFRHFQTKANVYKAVFMRFSPIPKVEEGLQAIESLPFWEGVQHIVELLCRHMEENRQFIQLFSQETPSILELQSIVNPLAIHEQLVEKMTLLLQRGVAMGEVRPELDLVAVSNTLLCILCSFLVVFPTKKLKPEESPDKMCKIAIDCFLRGLRP
jgi:AcrR family transcriptional regulator